MMKLRHKKVKVTKKVTHSSVNSYGIIEKEGLGLPVVEGQGFKENHFQLGLQKMMMRSEREGKRFSSTSGRGKH